MRLLRACLPMFVFVLGLAVTACGAPQDDHDGKRAGNQGTRADTLHRSGGAEPDTLDPHRSEETGGLAVVADLFEGLVNSAPDGGLVPGAAARWDISDDGLVYRFELRPEGRWSNGDPLVAEDFVAGFRRTVAPETGSSYAQSWWLIENGEAVTSGHLPVEALGVSALGEHVLEIRLHTPAPYFLSMLLMGSASPLHGPSFAEHGARFARAGVMVSNGPYILEEWAVQSHVLLRRNPYYHGRDDVRIETVRIHSIEDINSEFNRFRTGEIDVTTQIPNNQYNWVLENMPERLHSAPLLGTYYYLLNIHRPPFDDLRVRRAVSMTLDRSLLTSRVTGTGERPALGFVPEGTAGHVPVRPDWADWSLEQRQSEARRLLAEAGYGPDRPLGFEIVYNTSDNHRRIALAAASMWQEALGARASIINQEWKVMLQNRRDLSAWQVMRMGWIGGYDDPHTFLHTKLSGHGHNAPQWSNARFDELMARSDREPDPVLRTELMREAEQLLIDEHIIVPFYFYVSKRLVSPRVAHFQPTLTDVIRSGHLGLAP
ncbi:MAG: peptide ABC transporter substrate-binding protein [Gammaproteobacteria bacterium]|nr:peptide ABC transporter substrate-binding protein [Gammaproteobacteria bacterium]